MAAVTQVQVEAVFLRAQATSTPEDAMDALTNPDTGLTPLFNQNSGSGGGTWDGLSGIPERITDFLALGEGTIFVGSDGQLSTFPTSFFGKDLVACADAPAALFLLGAAASAHSHIIDDVTGLQAALDDKLSVSTTRSVNTVYAAPNGSSGPASFRLLVASDIPNLDASKLTTGAIGYARGGTGISAPGATAGNLRWTGSAYTIDATSYALASSVPLASTTLPAALGTAAVGTGTTWARADHVHAMPTATQVGAIPFSFKGAANGVADLDANGKVPSSQMYSYVDDVVEYASVSAFPSSGETGKIYVALDTNLVYRWSGSGYTEISPSLALGETPSTAYRGDRGKIAYDHSQTTGANPHGTTTAQISEVTNLYFTKARVRLTDLAGYAVGSNSSLAATDTVLGAFGKIQAQINARPGTLTGSGAAGQISYWSGASSQSGDGGLVGTQTSGVTRLLTLGDGAVDGGVQFRARGTVGNFFGFSYLRPTATIQWSTTVNGDGTTWGLRNYTTANAEIDSPLEVADGANGIITIGGAGRTTRFTGSTEVYRGTAGATAFSTRVSGESSARFIINADGGIFWGSGSVAVDTNLYRSAANVLRTDDTFSAFSVRASTELVSALALSDTIGSASRWKLIDSNESWGASGYIDAGGHLRLAYLRGDSTWTDRYYFGRDGSFKLLAHSGAAARMATIGADGLVSPVANAAAARTLIDAAQASHTHTAMLTGSGFELELPIFNGTSSVFSLNSFSVSVSGGNVTELNLGSDANPQTSFVMRGNFADVIAMEVGAVLRWKFGGTTSNWLLQAYDSAGAYIDDPITVPNALSGAIVFSRDISAPALGATNVGCSTLTANSVNCSGVVNGDFDVERLVYEDGDTSGADGVVIGVIGSGGATLPGGASTGTVLIYAGQLNLQTDTVTIPTGEALWYRSQSGASNRIVGPSSFSVNRQCVIVIKFASEWRVSGLLYV